VKNTIRFIQTSAFAFTLITKLHAGTLAAQADEPSPATSSDEGSTPESTQSDIDAPPAAPDDLKWSLGAAFIASPRPYVGTQARVFPVPALGLEYKRWFVQGIRGGYHFLKSDRFTANVFAQARFRGLEPDDSPFLEGMVERKKSMDAGLEFVYRGKPVGFRASFLTDTMGRSKGQEASLLAITGAPLGRRGIILFGIGPRWMSQNRVDYYYGIRQDEATSLRPAYTGEATWNLDINLTAVINVTSRWSVLALLNREGYGSGITNSPIVERTSAYALVTSLSYSF
jgi:outer membrane protein